MRVAVVGDLNVVVGAGYVPAKRSCCGQSSGGLLKRGGFQPINRIGIKAVATTFVSHRQDTIPRYCQSAYIKVAVNISDSRTAITRSAKPHQGICAVSERVCPTDVVGSLKNNKVLGG